MRNKMYDNESYEQFNRGKSLFIKISVCLCIVCVILGILFTGYKQEAFICSKKQNICYVEKTNLLNIKKRKTIIQYSEIKNFSFIKQRIKGNRVATGHTSYVLAVKNKTNYPIRIFSTCYYSKPEIDVVIHDLNKQLKNNNETIIYNRY